jgi:hypothetical protein
MAITAELTLTSAAGDLTSNALALSTTTSLTTAGTSTAISNTAGLARKTTGSTNIYTLFDGDAYGNGAHKIYLKNTETTAGLYFVIFVQDEQIGKLYAGDWAFFPWEANADTNDIKIQPSTSASHTLEYMLFYE